ncbi:plasma membrane localization protein [Basidiobolus ranarum]|uniref:Plasma membrane localization protein n=1 Tax=Basidiobolus ranarum TaxID=34480 RepID=A0ABR2WDG1_9FUNG
MEQRYRFMVVNEIIKRIDAECHTPKKHTLSKLLVSLLLNYTLIPGISVLELLGALIDYFSECLRSSTTDSTLTIEFTNIEDSLVNAIGALAKNIYYADQVTDIMSYILGKMKINDRRSEIDGVPASLFRVKMLQCLTAIVDNNRVASTTNSIVPRITFRVISLVLPFLKSESLDIRVACGKFLSACFENENTGTSHIPNRKLTINSRLVRRNSNPDMKFRGSVHKVLIDCVTGKSALPIDFAIVSAIFKQMLQRYVLDELVLTIPVMFKLQKYNETNENADFATRVFIDQLVGLYILRLGVQLNITEIIEHAEHVIEERQLANQWTPLFDIDEQKNFTCLNGMSMNDIYKDDDAKSNDYQLIPLSFQKILHILNHRVELKKRFTELEKRLTTDNSILTTEDSKKLISRTITSTSRVMHGLIPKFTFPTLHKSEKVNGIRKPVKFETLKEALKLSWDSTNEQEGDSSVKRSPSQTTDSRKSQKSSRSDMSLLLKTISSRASSASSSLVNTPCLSSASHP